MVAWYRPGELARTGVSVLTSAVLESRSDQRLVEALHAEPVEYYDYAVTDDGQPRSELWIDYVSDLGDGYDSTYAVARAVASDPLVVNDSMGHPHVTHRGRILVFGGDLVYPVASRAQYEQRLVMPYEHALPCSEAPHPDLYAIPGNHDWYDSLVAFSRRFCSQRWFAGWRTHQRVSYFALRLPADWWLIGTDVQLDSDIDADQVAYFKAIAAMMTDRARIILCNAEPHWIYQKKFAESDQRFSESNLCYLEDRVFERKIAVYLSGDLHHYRRHSDGAGHHKIVAGGGGAFLHPTHDADLSELPGGPGNPPYRLATSYPEVATSRRLAWRNLLFPVTNWRLGFALGVLYLLTCRALAIDVAGLGLRDIGQAANLVLCAVLRGPTALLWIVFVVGAVVLFADAHSRRYRLVAGALHATAHLATALLVGWAAVWTAGELAAATGPLPVAVMLLATGALVLVGGWLVGGLVIGGYLLVSLNGFGRHDNEAFSSLAIADWKNFLRLHIDATGTLRIYPFGIDRVPRRWQDGGRGRGPVPDDPRATPPRLIEDPIVVIR
jgi:hypothetical protein